MGNRQIKNSRKIIKRIVMDYSDRYGDWIITYTGKRFYPLDPRPDDINIGDIAHSLSLLNRFTGHSKVPYSVAQHCIAVSKMLTTSGYPELALSGLLHDASEAYVNDLARPLKQILTEYQQVENKILDVIDKKFNVNTRHPLVKEFDTKCLVAEATTLCNGEQWYLGDKYPPRFDYIIRESDWRQDRIDFIEIFMKYNNNYE
jgi:5'-deoxynucleotidase YfbR-like HD superfamily hydrolase